MSLTSLPFPLQMPAGPEIACFFLFYFLHEILQVQLALLFFHTESNFVTELSAADENSLSCESGSVRLSDSFCHLVH